MILNQTRVEQAVDLDDRGVFTKELVLLRFSSSSGAQIPLAMVRKRDPSHKETIGSVLLIHGYGQNRYAWHLPARSISNFLARAGFDVFNLDLRGHGRSRHFGARRPNHVSDFAREDIPAVVDEVRRISGSRPVFLIGHSLGGLISYGAATVLGPLAAGVITIGSPYLFTRGSLPLTVLGKLMLTIDQTMPLGHGALALRGAGEAIRLARGLIESPIFPLPIRGFSPRSMESFVLEQHMALAMDYGSITVLRNMFLDAAMWRQSGARLGGLSGFAEGFETLNLPMLIIAGEHDDLAPPPSVAPAFEKSRSTDKTYRVFPQGHIDLLMGRDAPRTIWPLMESWLRSRAERSNTSATARNEKAHP